MVQATRATPAPPRKQRASRLDSVTSTRERILEAAARCLRRVGLERLSVEEVARHAGVSRGSVYRYFPERTELTNAVLERAAEHFVAESRLAVERRRTLAAQVGEAAAFIRTHLHDEMTALQLPAEHETLLATLLTVRVGGLVDRWVTFWLPFLAEAQTRGEIRRGLDHREAAEWIVRMLLSIAVMPSVVVDLDEPAAVLSFVQKYIVRGLGGS
jgi:AcrR family transcriptional regulator